MKTGLVVAGLLLALLSAVVGCGAFGMGLMFVEPPHPSWATHLEPPPGAGPQKTPPLSDGDYEVWIAAGGACTLDVHASDGSAIGRSSGDACRVDGKAKAGDVWTIEATGVGPRRSVYLGKDDSVFPAPLKLTAFSSLVVFALALSMLLGAAFLPAKKTAAGEDGQLT